MTIEIMRRFKSLIFILVSVALFQAAAMQAARADDAAMDAQAGQHQVRLDFAKDFAQKVLAILQDPRKSYADNKDLLRRAFADSVDIDWIARFVLGKSWKAATPQQQAQYTALYRKYLTESYVSHFADDPSKRIRDIRISGVNDSEGNNFIVRSEMMLADFDNLKVNYLVHDDGGHYKVLDIIIENVSLITTHRNEFSALAQASGIKGVIARLESLLSAKSPLMLSMK